MSEGILITADRFSAAMHSRARWLALVAVWLLVRSPGSAAAGRPSSGTPERLRNHFDSDAVLGAPGYFDFVVLGPPGPAQWKVTVGTNPPSTPNVATQTFADRPGGSIAAAVRRSAVFRDGSVSVALEKGSGRGGLVFRLADDKTFCSLLVDLSSGQARLAAWRAGGSEELGRGQADLANEWGVLAVELKGSEIEAKWNGKPLLQATDPRPAAGRAGMATEGPGMVSFDEFLLEWAATR
jgi:hypothetical protein